MRFHHFNGRYFLYHTYPHYYQYYIIITYVFFCEEAKMEYITQNKKFFLAQGIPGEGQSHNMYKERETENSN